LISKRDLIARGEAAKEQKISPELQKMHEIFGDQNADCGMATQYEDGTCSKIVYDPAKMLFTKRTGLDFSSTAPIKDYPTQAETHAARLLDFSTAIISDKPRDKRWRNQS
jgi:hypothetical protein